VDNLPTCPQKLITFFKVVDKLGLVSNLSVGRWISIKVTALGLADAQGDRVGVQDRVMVIVSRVTVMSVFRASKLLKIVHKLLFELVYR
jgi:hypothetical protein